jgi:hypothetical protein
MAALQLLLDRMNSGNVPINKSVWEQLQGSGDTKQGDSSQTNITNLAAGSGGKQVCILCLVITVNRETTNI